MHLRGAHGEGDGEGGAQMGKGGNGSNVVGLAEGAALAAMGRTEQHFSALSGWDSLHPGP